MNKLFGKNFQMRFLKLTEEYHELFVVADDMLVNKQNRRNRGKQNGDVGIHKEVTTS